MGYTITDIAYFFNNTKGAIRFYEDKGFITPERNAAGYRIYYSKDILQLFYLRRYREYGFSVQETIDYFRSDNVHSLNKLLVSLEEKDRELEQRQKELANMRLWLKDYQSKIKSFINYPDSFILLKINGYIYLNIDYFEKGTKSKDIIHAWINASPWTNIHVEVSRNDNDEPIYTPGIGITQEEAKRINLPVPKEAIYLPPSNVVMCMIKGKGADFMADPGQQIRQKRKELESKGYKPVGEPHLSLLFSNIENGQEVKYFDLVWRINE